MEMDNDLLLYSDPLITLLKDPNLNKDKEKTKELIQIINEIDDNQIKSWCIESFEILRDLEKIEVKINNWEFQTLDFNLSLQITQTTTTPTKKSLKETVEEIEKRKINSELAKRVSNHCLDLHKILSELSLEIDELNIFNRQLTPVQRISDPGTILTELSLRVIKLKNVLSDEISIHYSKARLVNIGLALEKLIEDEDNHPDNSDENGDNDGVITDDTVRNYKAFINNLLLQLNDCVSSNDTIGAMECISIVNDVEKMFESMRMQKLQAKQQKRIVSAPPLEKNLTGSDTPSSSTFDDTLYSGFDDEDEEVYDDEDMDKMNKSLSTIKIDERRQRRFNNSRMMAFEHSSLHRSTISEELPYLMSAFEDAKAVEEELREVMKPPQARPKKTKSKKLSTSKLNEAALREHDRRQNTASPDRTTELKRTSSHSTSMSSSTQTTNTMVTAHTAHSRSNSTITSVKPTREQLTIHGPAPPPSLQKDFHSQPPPRLPSAYVQKTFLSSFLKPMSKPMYIDESLQLRMEPDEEIITTEEGALVMKREASMSSVKKAQEKFAKYRRDEELRDLRLSPQKVSSIQIGKGRVKYTVNDIEQQLPRDLVPPTPIKGASQQTSPQHSQSPPTSRNGSVAANVLGGSLSRVSSPTPASTMASPKVSSTDPVSTQNPIIIPGKVSGLFGGLWGKPGVGPSGLGSSMMSNNIKQQEPFGLQDIDNLID